MNRIPTTLNLAMASVLLAGVAWAGPTAEAKCQAGKNKVASQYASCLQKAEAKLVQTQGACAITVLDCYLNEDCPGGEMCVKDETKYLASVDKCDTKYSTKWQKLEEKAENAETFCPSHGDEAAIRTFTQRHSANEAARLSLGCNLGYDGVCWYYSAFGESCEDVCNALDLVVSTKTESYAGSAGTLENCADIWLDPDATVWVGGPFVFSDFDCSDLGCHYADTGSGFAIRRCVNGPASNTASDPDVARLCACE